MTTNNAFLLQLIVCVLDQQEDKQSQIASLLWYNNYKCFHSSTRKNRVSLDIMCSRGPVPIPIPAPAIYIVLNILFYIYCTDSSHVSIHSCSSHTHQIQFSSYYSFFLPGTMHSCYSIVCVLDQQKDKAKLHNCFGIIVTNVFIAPLKKIAFHYYSRHHVL